VNNVIWMRVGDADDYHGFDHLDEVADELAVYSVLNIERYCRYGVSAPGFDGHNYISLYWGPDPGDGSAEASRELTDAEFCKLQVMLDQRHGLRDDG